MCALMASDCLCTDARTVNSHATHTLTLWPSAPARYVLNCICANADNVMRFGDDMSRKEEAHKELRSRGMTDDVHATAPDTCLVIVFFWLLGLVTVVSGIV